MLFGVLLRCFFSSIIQIKDTLRGVVNKLWNFNRRCVWSCDLDKSLCNILISMQQNVYKCVVIIWVNFTMQGSGRGRREWTLLTICQNWRWLSVSWCSRTPPIRQECSSFLQYLRNKQRKKLREREKIQFVLKKTHFQLLKTIIIKVIVIFLYIILLVITRNILIFLHIV